MVAAMRRRTLAIALSVPAAKRRKIAIRRYSLLLSVRDASVCIALVVTLVVARVVVLRKIGTNR
jgi:hypothetical protein